MFVVITEKKAQLSLETYVAMHKRIWDSSCSGLGF